MRGRPDIQDFDYFIAVDWSAKATPSPRRESKDAIWIGEGGTKRCRKPRYFRTRHDAITYLRKRLLGLARRKQRVLVGWDFAFGYPKGLDKMLRLGKKQAWSSIWNLLSDHIKDKRDNANNRFAVAADINRRVTGGSGPFWGVVGKDQSGVLLRPCKDFKYPVKNRRGKLAERRLVEQRRRRMQPAWKLAYTGSVGSQALLGIPRVLQLTQDEKLAKVSQVWPFETGFAEELAAKGGLILHAEIYPSHLSLPKKDKIPDREQVRHYVKWLREEQARGKLIRWLAGPDDLTEKERRWVLRHEGWVLGIE